MLSIDAIWSDRRDDDVNVSWVRSFWSEMQRHSTGRFYLNFAGHGEDGDLVRQALGDATYARLQQVKRRYDPQNLFHLNQNIKPARS
jgi:FAD/FMN-containing dehydrogenase